MKPSRYKLLIDLPPEEWDAIHAYAKQRDVAICNGDGENEGEMEGEGEEDEGGDEDEVVAPKGPVYQYGAAGTPAATAMLSPRGGQADDGWTK